MTDTPPDREEALADALEDMHRRRARGEDAIPDDYRGRLGDSHEDFMKIVAAETRLDGTLAPAPAEALPRPFAGFTLLREIGRGASGVVYEAVDRRLGRTVALKILRTGVDTDSTALERFRREAKACAHVRHDHIVAIHEAGETDGRPWYSMDLVPGEPLSSAVRGGERLDPKLLAAGVAGVADGLHALHAAGIVHRDVKPQNLIVRPDGQMILADFGLARSAQAVALTQTGDALGTPLYMSPEQMLGQKGEVDARTDVYGLGATMYEALCGRPVFRTEDVASLMRMILTQRPDPVRAHAPGVPADLEGIVMKCLEKRKGDRYPSAAALADDLRAFVKDEPVVGRPIGPAVRAVRAARRHWIPIATAAGVLVAGLAWWNLRPGKLTFLSPEGVPFRVQLNSQDIGLTPLTVTRPPGTYGVLLYNDTFKGLATKVSVTAGAEAILTAFLSEREDKKDEAGRIAAKATNTSLPGPAPERPPGMRSEASGPALIAPRGDARLSDVAALVADMGNRPGTLRMTRGGDELWNYRPKLEQDRWIPLPDSVRSRLRVGDTVLWGWYPDPERDGDKPEAIEASFRVVDRDVSKQLSAIERWIAPQDRDRFRVQAYRDAGLSAAAFRIAYALAQRAPDQDEAWTPLLHVLDDLKLLESKFAREVFGWIESPRGLGAQPPTLEEPAK